MEAKRERWIDLIKVTACLLVVLGHVLRGLISAGIFPEDGVARSLVEVVYYFHVNLFFFCSGWLFMKRHEPGIKGYFSNMGKKLIDLVVPYAVFLSAGYILKLLFPSSVNNPGKYSFFETLFLRPDAPYWYLYALFFIFLITPPVKNRRSSLYIFLVSALAKVIYVIFLTDANLPYFLKCIMENWIWFASGMVVCSYSLTSLLSKRSFAVPVVTLGGLFIPLSLLIQIYSVSFPFMETLMGFLGCILVISLSYIICSRRSMKFTGICVQYTLPVFLMHTLSAPAVRAVLIKLSVTNGAVHFILGMLSGIFIPVLVAYIMKLLVIPEIVLYPRRTVKKLKAR